VKKQKKSISIEEVESAESIYKKICYGAQCHSVYVVGGAYNVAIAYEPVRRQKNTGEGGEDEVRYKKLENGDSMRSSIKQIASRGLVLRASI